MQENKLRFWSPVESQGHSFDRSNFSDLPRKQGQFWPENANWFQPHEDNRQKNTQSHKFNNISLPNQP